MSRRAGPVLAPGERLGVPVREASPSIAYSGVLCVQDSNGRPGPEAITVEALMKSFAGPRVGV
jgi:hypothetical protein